MTATGSRELAINGRFLTQPTTGVQRVARELTREIDRLVEAGEYDIDVRLLCEPGADASELDLHVTRVETVPGGHGHRWEQRRLPRAVGNARLLCLGNTAPVWSLLRGGPVAVMIHDLSYRLYPEAYALRYRLGHGAMLPLLLKWANPVITVAETERSILQSIAPGVRDRIVVAQNGGWREEPAIDRQQVPKPRTGDGYLLYVGSFSQRKNFAGVLDAAIRMAREDGVPFVFAGAGGPILSPTSLAIPPELADKITFVGQVEALDRLAELYSGARCLVFPSFYEASPLPPLEAMRFGCPVVASDIASLRERCADAAEYCDPRNVDDIVAAVRRVINDPWHAGALAQRGFARTRRFSWRTQARTLLDSLFR